ncbi:mitochondrial mRNA pseudouridine synthase RPUSD3-like [Hetaerina americana]|uniref:mitochondrial mRNA pseudouridine synthase RPUSD3-like n=1 Tax=Hetaerina americana TaxID=62018 RepID=UPI003A7F48CC
MAISYNLSGVITHCRNCAKLSGGVVQLFSSVAYKQHFRKNDHVYDNVSRWKSKRELADYLLDNMLLNQDGLIVLNKPYGIGAYQRPENANMPKDIPRDDKYNLSDALPYIGNALGVDHLTVIKCAEKFSSGVSILASSEKALDRIKTCRRRAMCSKKVTSKYLCVALDRPQDTDQSEIVKVALSGSPDGKTFQPVIFDVRRPPNTKYAISVSVQLNTLCTNGYGASLVEIKPSSTQWHFIRVYMAHKLAPLLGDNIHGPRVKYCMGIPVAVNPFNIQDRTKVLNPSIRRRLSLEQGEESIIPCHVHLKEVTFVGWHRDKSDLTVIAPTPPFFTWTCKQLDLEIKD